MEKIKSFIGSEQGKDILIIIIVILVGLISFELGRLSKSDLKSGIKIEYPDQTNQEANALNAISQLNSQNSLKQPFLGKNQVNTEGSYFASKMGHKYYSISCSAGKTIKQENRVYFSSAAQAETAGYSLSSGCK